MTTRKTIDWKRLLLLTAVGGVSIVALLVVVGVGALFWASSVAEDLGEPTVVAVAQTVPTSVTSRGSTSMGGGGPVEALRLDIELRDGRFEVVAGPPGSDVRVDGEYADNYYELLEEHEVVDSGEARTSIRFGPTTSGLVRLMAAAKSGWDSFASQNDVRVAIPSDLPVLLSLEVRQGESRIDLGGLTLVDLDVELSMGNHWLGFSDPVSRAVERVQIEGRFGNVELERLGNARAREILTSSSMGNFTVDLGGGWQPGTTADVSFDHSMGELSLRIPTTVRVAEDSTSSATFAGTGGMRRDEETGGPDAPVLKLDLSTSMGDTSVRRYSDPGAGD